MTSRSSRPRNTLFVNRSLELERLAAWYSSERPVMVISGRPGVGKTALALAFADHISSRFYYFRAAEILRSYAVLDPVSSTTYRSRRRQLVIVDEMEAMTAEEQFKFISAKVLPRGRFRRELAPAWILIGRLDTPLKDGLEIDQLQLGGLDHAAVEQLIRARLSESNAYERLIADGVSRAVIESLMSTPRMLIELLNRYELSGDIASSAIDAIRTTDPYPSNLLITPGQNQLTAFPTEQLTPELFEAPSGELVAAVPYVTVTRTASAWRGQLEEFNALLNTASSTERDFQSFFERNPHFLHGSDYVSVVAQPILEREEGNLIPDFFLQPVDSRFADILELKRPNVQLFVGSKDRLRTSAALNEALAQVREYRDYFDDRRRRELVEKRYGLTAFRPAVAIVVGRTPDLDETMRRKILDKEERDRTRVITYDHMFNKMKRLVEIMSE